MIYYIRFKERVQWNQSSNSFAFTPQFKELLMLSVIRKYFIGTVQEMG